MVVKTYRGLLADGAQDRIKLQTITGKVGYRIVKFDIIGPDANENIESTVKIYKEEQSSIDDKIDFSDNSLLAAATMSGTTSSTYNTAAQVIVFDQEIFNQDIYVTLKGADYTSDMNYYIELEVIPLSSDQAAITTVKAIRGLAED